MATNKEIAEAIIDSARSLEGTAKTLRLCAKRIKETGNRHPAFEVIETILNINNTSEMMKIVMRLSEEKENV